MHRSLTKLILWIIPVLVALAGVIWWLHPRGGPKLTFTMAAVKRGDVTATIGATGTIEPLEVVDVGAQVAGIIKAFGTDVDGKIIDYGSVVKEGALLAKIDEATYVADLAVAKAQLKQDKAGELSAHANLEQMKAKLKQTEAEWKRSKALLDAKLMSQSDFDTAEANFQIARANADAADAAVAQAEASTVQALAAVDKAQRNLEYCTIHSPVTGVIIDRRVNAGQTVVASLNAPSLFLIARDLTKMQIWVSVNEADVGRIKPGAPVTFTVDAFPNRDFKGTVGKVRLNATMTQNVVLYTVEINIDNPQKLLLPYLTANVRFQLNRQTNTLVVPNAALRWTPSSLAEVAPDARNSDLVDPPGDPKLPSPPPAQKDAAAQSARRMLWMKAGDFVRPLEVAAGISDGANTAVTADSLREGDEVVTGEVIGAASNVSNPFLPKIIRR